ncbi:MAG: GNAT family N-acetyltransferase [Chloroflexi bacterium]|nr:GNAT family N-acetyltransferase [Chloroflexota bacterium]
MKTLRLHSISLTEYESFLRHVEGPAATLFHHPLWLAAVAEGLRWDLAIVGASDDDGLVGALPGFIVRKGPFRLFGSPLRGSMTPYLGWVWSNGHTGQQSSTAHLDEVYRYCCRQLGCQYVEIGCREVSGEDLEGMRSNGWSSGLRETYLLDLTLGEKALWDNLESRGRRFVRSAERQGVEIENVSDAGIIDDFYTMLQHTFGRHNSVSPHPKRLFECLRDRLVPNGMMNVLVARREGQVIAIGLFPHDSHEIHFLSGASFAEYHKLRPNNLLHWHSIKWAADAGLHVYDLGGKGQPSIDNFKETFGPKAHAYRYFWRARMGADLARRLFLRALPLVRKLYGRTRRGANADHLKPLK